MAVATPGVIIDACVPRNSYERCVVLFDYLVEISEVEPHSSLDPEQEKQRLGLRTDWEGWTEHEDSIIDLINRVLPDNLVCTVGEFNPGDVIVREVQDESEEMS